jgi:hypothetical protein
MRGSTRADLVLRRSGGVALPAYGTMRFRDIWEYLIDVAAERSMPAGGSG